MNYDLLITFGLVRSISSEIERNRTSFGSTLFDHQTNRTKRSDSITEHFVITEAVKRVLQLQKLIPANSTIFRICRD